MKTFLAGAIFAIAQTLAWFQSNSGIIGGWMGQNYIYIALAFGPFVSVMFAFATKMMYEQGVTLWSIRFLTFGMGYLVFIPLTWYFLGEEIITFKNIVSFFLCVALISIQFFLK
jgi:hypothetical protein